MEENRTTLVGTDLMSVAFGEWGRRLSVNGSLVLASLCLGLGGSASLAPGKFQDQRTILAQLC